MAVLCEALSVVIRRRSLMQYFRGGALAFMHTVPNDTLCTDGELIRVGFMTPSDVRDYIQVLEFNGLQAHLGERTQDEPDEQDEPVGAWPHAPSALRAERDVVVVDQFQGPWRPSAWMECSRMRINETDWVTVACLVGPAEFDGAESSGISAQELEDRRMQLFTPLEWTFDGSLSDKTLYVDVDDMPRRMRFLREEDGLDIYLDTETDKEVYVGRTR